MRLRGHVARGLQVAWYDDVVKHLTRRAILDALHALSGELERAGEHAELGLLGGAALVLLYNAREATKDVDAVVLAGGDSAPVRAAAARVASELGLPEDWLNDAAKGYLHGIALGETIMTSGSLVVRALAPQQLLAMKLSAWRDDLDIEDARLLLSKLPSDRVACWNLLEPFLLQGRELKAQYAFDDLWEERHGSP